MTTGSLTVLFEDPFWIGLFEMIDQNGLRVCKVTNPKRQLREAKKQMQSQGIGTKSQQALKLQQEQNKAERKHRSKAEREAEKKRQFDLRQAKKKEKHRGH